jgi:hypothetical protein
LVGIESRLSVATFSSSCGTGLPFDAMTEPTGVLCKSSIEAMRCSGVCTARKYGVPVAGSVQKFGDTCTEDDRLTLRLVATLFAVRPNWAARARSITA